MRARRIGSRPVTRRSNWIVGSSVLAVALLTALTGRAILISDPAGTVGLRPAVRGLEAGSGGSPAVAPAPQPGVTPAPQRRTPAVGARWQWILGAPFNLTDPQHLGVGWKDPAGNVVAPPTVYDIDGFTNTAATVAALHQKGALVVCYIETGAWESYRPDATAYPAEVLGLPLEGYKEERYVDIRSPMVFARVSQRVQMCADKGFDAIEPDIDDSYTQKTGFAITQADNVSFNGRVADLAHSLGLSIALKNGDDLTFATAMQPIVDFALVEQCFEFDTCASFATFSSAHKAVLEVEYNLPAAKFCEHAATLGFSAIKQQVNLTGGGTPCP